MASTAEEPRLAPAEPARSALADPSPAAAAEALFAEARARARRRRRRRAACAIGAFALATAVAGVIGGDEGNPARPEPRRAVQSGQVLSRAPYMGVACRRPNSVACDRVGLAVWTRQPARAVRATVAGRTFALDDRQWSGQPRSGLRRMFAGFLHHAGLKGNGVLAVEVENGRDRWTGRRPVVASVHLSIVFPNGTIRTTRTRVYLAPGWG